MKKLLSVIAALTIGASAWAAYEYNATIDGGVVSITDLSAGGAYRYKLEFDQNGFNIYDEKTYPTSVTLYLNAQSASIAGTFSLKNGGIDRDLSYIYYSKGTPTDRYFMDYNDTKITEITIKDLGEGKYSLEGALRSNPSSGNYYYYYYAAADNVFTTKAADPYKDEPAEAKTMDICFDNLELDSREGKTPIALYACDKTTYDPDIELVFNVSTFNVPAGDYTLSTSGRTGTVQVSDGTKENYFYTGSWVCTYPSRTTVPYFLVDGTLTVSYAEGRICIKGTVTSAHGSTINIDLSGENPFPTVDPEPVDPYEEEPAASDFTVVFAAEPYVYELQDTILLEFNNSDLDCISLAFAASSKDDILPCRYLVNSSHALGTLIASAGTAGDWEYPSFYAKAFSIFGYYPYYITEGYVDVDYKGEMLYITGVVTTSKGSNITLDISGKNTLTTPVVLPANMLEGYVDGHRYLLAYDITTTTEGCVSVAATIWTDGQVSGLKPQAVIGSVASDMAYDASTGACSCTSRQKYSKGEKLAVSIILGYDGGGIETRSVEYVVE